MRRVPQEAVLRTARIFRTTGGPLRYRMSRMPQMPGKRSLPQTTLPEIHKCQGKGLFPRQYYRKSNKHQKRGLFPYSTIGKFLTNARKKGLFPRQHYRKSDKHQKKETSSCIAPSANPHECQRKEAFSRIAPPEIQQTPKRGLFLYSTIGKFPAAAIPWQQGIVYSGGGAPTHRFNYFLTLFL